MPSAALLRDRGGVATPIAAAVVGGSGLVVAAVGFFLSSSPGVMAVLGAAALAGAIGAAALGIYGLRRPLGEVSVIGIVAGGLSLPLGVFDLLMAASGHLG